MGFVEQTFEGSPLCLPLNCFILKMSLKNVDNDVGLLSFLHLISVSCVVVFTQVTG